MIKTERHFNTGNDDILYLCRMSKLLYNKCNFYMRTAYFSKEYLPDINILVCLTQKEEYFKNLHNTKTAKQTIRKCLTDWANFKKAKNSYFKDKSKFKSCPRPPGYKKKLAQVIFYNETIKKNPIKNGIIIPTNYCFEIKSNIKDFKQVVITPKTFGFIIDVSYEAPNVKKTKQEGICAIDLGVNNLCSISSDQHSPILINGRIIKSINHYFNKNKCKRTSRKRYFRIENYFHHTSNFIINNCLNNKVGTIIIGKNDGWKQNTKKKKKLSSKVRKMFQSIPYNNLIQKLQYKAEQVGINIIFTEEAYTSKASYLDRDLIPEYDKNKESPIFSGRRIKRGLYQAKNGEKLNADINGSANILRKVIQNEKILFKLDMSVAATPVVVNPLKLSYM